MPMWSMCITENAYVEYGILKSELLGKMCVSLADVSGFSAPYLSFHKHQRTIVWHMM